LSWRGLQIKSSLEIDRRMQVLQRPCANCVSRATVLGAGWTFRLIAAQDVARERVVVDLRYPRSAVFALILMGREAERGGESVGGRSTFARFGRPSKVSTRCPIRSRPALPIPSSPALPIPSCLGHGTKAMRRRTESLRRGGVGDQVLPAPSDCI
jgi:hypothetical protein